MDYSLKLASPARQGMMHLNKKQLLYCRFLRVLETSVLEHKLAEGTSWAPFARSYTSKGKEHFHACYHSLHKTSYFRHSTHSTVKGKVSARAPGWGEALPSRRKFSEESIPHGAVQPDCKSLQSWEDPHKPHLALHLQNVQTSAGNTQFALEQRSGPTQFRLTLSRGQLQHQTVRIWGWGGNAESGWAGHAGLRLELFYQLSNFRGKG